MTNANDLMNAAVKPGFTYSDGSYEESTISGGLTKREYFAAMAMQGLSACSGEYNNQTFHILIAKHSIMIADALIEELNKQSK